MSVKKGSEIIKTISEYIDELLPNHVFGLKESIRLLLNNTWVVPEEKWKLYEKASAKLERMKTLIEKRCKHCKTYNLYDSCHEDCGFEELKELIKDEKG